jgi:hypothetical protein
MQPLACRDVVGTSRQQPSSAAGMITGVLPMGSFFRPPHLVRFIEVELSPSCARSLEVKHRLPYLGLHPGRNRSGAANWPRG